MSRRRTHTHLPISLALVGVLALISGCAPKSIEAAAPLDLSDSAYAAAGHFELGPPKPLDLPDGPHNVFALSENIFSGGEPESPAAVAAIASLGVKTILSVDGKVPDVEAAEQHGLRYVHVPIQYKGMTDDELLRIAKTFRELEGPFYVHCFHGQHRGPAAAAVGRLLLDGAPRDQGIAEMRQWCGTSSKYEGLYQAIAAGEIPSAEETAAYEWDFPAAQPLGGMRQVMIDAARAYGRIKDKVANGWQVDPSHPDIDPGNEAAILADLFERAQGLDELATRPADFRAWMADSLSGSRALHAAIGAAREQAFTSGDAPDWGPSEAAFATLKASCSACHEAYRN